MTEQTFRQNNHYLPCSYLKLFATGEEERLFVYRTLVSHSKVPLWVEKSPRGIAYQRNLYTRIEADTQSDEIERWLDREFEAPAAEPLRKATSDSRLTSEDWCRLVRFVAAQRVRTPASFFEAQERWSSTLPKLLEESMAEGLEELRRAKQICPRSNSAVPQGQRLPFRIKTELEPGQGTGTLTGRVAAGRSMWLYQIQHLLQNTADILHEHRWTILKPPKGLTWFTSDNPVVQLNFNHLRDYDFGGGWGSKGSEILFPLGPHHLLYTQIGKRHPPRRGTEVEVSKAKILRRFMAQHAYRFIVSSSEDLEVSLLRPRKVDSERYESEQEQWLHFHDEQVSAEQKLHTWADDKDESLTSSANHDSHAPPRKPT